VILDQTTERVPGRSRDVLVIRIRHLERFNPRNLVLGKVHVHLVAVKVCIVRVTVGVVHANGLLPWQNPDAVTHYGRLVEGRLPVHEDHITVGEMPVNFLIPRAAEVIPSRGQQLVCESDTVLERFRAEIDDLAILVLDGRGARPFV
jgi:hypothetical protein